VSFNIPEIVANRIRKETKMANIGATTAFYKVETSLTRANNEVSKSMERLATGKQNANAGDRSSYAAMADTFRLDYVGTKAGIKGASVVMGYLETGMRVLDSASALLARLQELAVLGANDTNSMSDHEAINQEAEAIAQEFNRLMQSATYKGKDIFVDTAGSEYVSMGGRDAEMTFGVGKIDYSEVYGATRTIEAGLPNEGQLMNLTSMPSDAVMGPTFSTTVLKSGKIYEITNLPTDATELAAYKTKLLASGATTLQTDAEIKVGSTFTVTSDSDLDLTYTGAFGTLKKGETYKVTSLQADGNVAASPADIDDNNGNTSLLSEQIAANSDVTADFVANTTTFTMTADLDVSAGNYEFQRITTENGDADGTFAEFREIDASEITRNIESVQKKINNARVQAGSQYAALESAVIYTTDLTAQYELGYNTVHDVNFSMETAHLAKNQILQQAATAMLAQANQGQQGLLQLIQG
jgi:flagellin